MAPTHRRRTADKLMTPGEKTGLDAINAFLFLSLKPGLLSLFADFVIGHTGTYSVPTSTGLAGNVLITNNILRHRTS